MAEYQKPPLGVSPHWFVHHKRIQELNEAISRYIDYISQHHSCIDTKEHYRVISKWAKEIETLSLLIAKLDEKEKDNG